MLTILTRNLDVIPNEVATCTTDATFTCILILIWLGINVCKEFTDKKNAPPEPVILHSIHLVISNIHVSSSQSCVDITFQSNSKKSWTSIHSA